MNSSASRMIRLLTRDKRKLSIMICLLTVGMLLWGRILLKQLPKSAVADPNAVANAQVDPNAASGLKTSLNDRQTVFVDMTTEVTRDLFGFHARHFPLEKPKEVKVIAQDDDPADNPSALRAAVQDKARQLTLQTTIMGSEARAVINGTLVRPGEFIRGFELKEVGRRSVTLQMNGILVELEM